MEQRTITTLCLTPGEEDRGRALLPEGHPARPRQGKLLHALRWVHARIVCDTSTLRSLVWHPNTCVCTKAGTSFAAFVTVISFARLPARGCRKVTDQRGGWFPLIVLHLIGGKHETWWFWHLSFPILWKAPRLWITLPEDRRHHQASLKSRLKKKTHFYHTGFSQFIRLHAKLWTCICKTCAKWYYTVVWLRLKQRLMILCNNMLIICYKNVIINRLSGD